MTVRLIGKQNIYLEIAEQYKHYINMNVLKEDEKLPSCRVLAMELGVNPNTVERAYAVLEEEGYIVNIPKKGAFVRCRDRDKNDMIEAAQNHLSYFKAAGLTLEQMQDLVENVFKSDSGNGEEVK